MLSPQNQGKVRMPILTSLLNILLEVSLIQKTKKGNMSAWMGKNKSFPMIANIDNPKEFTKKKKKCPVE